MQTFTQLIVSRRFEDGISLFVGQASCTSNHAWGETRSFDAAVAIVLNENGMRQAIDIRFETADPIAQTLWQHWDYAIREIDAIAASPRFSVHRAIRLYIGRDIGNVHAKPPAVLAGLFNIDRVIEITRVIRIDRDDKFFAQIFAVSKQAIVNGWANSVGFIDHGLGKFGRQMIAPDDRKKINPGRTGWPQHLNDLAFRVNVTRFPRIKPNHHFIVDPRRGSGGLRPPIFVRPNINVMHKSRIVGDDVVKVS